jgi:hypothetical protein
MILLNSKKRKRRLIIAALAFVVVLSILIVMNRMRTEQYFFYTNNIHVTQIEFVVNGSFVNVTDMININKLPQLLSKLKLKATLIDISPYYTADEQWALSGRSNGKLFNIMLGKDNIVYCSGDDIIKYRITNPDELIKWLNIEAVKITESFDVAKVN